MACFVPDLRPKITKYMEHDGPTDAILSLKFGGQPRLFHLKNVYMYLP